MLINPNDAYEVAQSIIDTIVTVYQEYDGVTPLPGRQFVYAGGPSEQPHDCEQLSVGLDQIYVGMPGQPSQTPARCDTPRSGVYSVELVRKTTPQQPLQRGQRISEVKTAEQEDAFAKIQMQDLMLLLEAGMRVADDGIGGVADVAAGPESGGYQAMTMTLIIGLVAY